VTDAWRALPDEPALEPELPICDPHHHLWEHPGSVYLAADFLGELGGHRLTHSVFVECLQHYRSAGPEALRPVGETEWIDALAAATDAVDGGPRLAAGIVAFADLSLGAAVGGVLDAQLAASRRVRAVRYATAWDGSDQVRPVHTHPPQGLMGSEEFRRGFAELVRRDLAFDAWLYPAQFGELAALATAFPTARIVLDHMGGPLGVGPYAGRRQHVLDAWRAGLAEVASCPNVSIKLGGRTMTSAGFGWHKRPAPPGSEELATAFRPYFDACIGLFGPARCMLESNFPMDRASCSYAVLWNAFKRATAAYSPGERAALLRHTAMTFYRLDR
jgi:L-fuconolactonase